MHRVHVLQIAFTHRKGQGRGGAEDGLVHLVEVGHEVDAHAGGRGGGEEGAVNLQVDACVL